MSSSFDTVIFDSSIDDNDSESVVQETTIYELSDKIALLQEQLEALKESERRNMVLRSDHVEAAENKERDLLGWAKAVEAKNEALKAENDELEVQNAKLRRVGRKLKAKVTKLLRSESI